MKTIMKKLSELKRPEKNCRIHTDRQLKEIIRSLEMFGQIRPIVIDENNVMLCGNGLYEALLQMGKTEASCYQVKGLSEAEKKKLMLADNKIYTLGTDDLSVFDEWLRELGDIDIPGYDQELLETILADTPEVDEMVTDYGNFTDASVNSIKKHEEAHEAGVWRASDRSAEENEQTPVRTAEAAESPSESPYIVCPNCGHHIPVR